MSVPPENDGRASARTRFRIFTGRARAGRRWTGRAFQSLVAASALAALGVSACAGSASAATAPPARPTITGVTWHQLTLINGWVSGQSQFPGDGIPAWTVRNGVVYLTGSVIQTSGTNSEFAVLPPAARPSHYLYMTVSVAGQGTSGWVVVYPNGAMYAAGDPYSDAQGFTGLAGISYPAKTMAMSTLSLENGWQSSDSQYGTGDPSYSVRNGEVHLSGSLLQPPAPGGPAEVLPVHQNRGLPAGQHRRRRHSDLPGRQAVLRQLPGQRVRGVHLTRRDLLPARLLARGPSGRPSSQRDPTGRGRNRAVGQDERACRTGDELAAQPQVPWPWRELAEELGISTASPPDHPGEPTRPGLMNSNSPDRETRWSP